MSAVLVALLVILVPVALAVVAVAAVKRRDDAVKREVPRNETLRYRVPEGQDPAAVLAALEVEGYAATMSPAPASDVVVIPCQRGADHERAHVRAVIAHAALNLEDDPGDHPVRFADESGRA